MKICIIGTGYVGPGCGRLLRIKEALASPMVVDGRNLYKPERMRSSGFTYLPLGRCGGEVC